MRQRSSPWTSVQFGRHSRCTLSWRADLLARTLSRLGRAWVMPSPLRYGGKNGRCVALRVLQALANRPSPAARRQLWHACGDYRNASLDADYITWWQQAPGLVNEPTRAICTRADAGHYAEMRPRWCCLIPGERGRELLEQIWWPTATVVLWRGSSWSSTTSAPCARSVTAQATLEEECEVAELRSRRALRGCQHSPRAVCLSCGNLSMRTGVRLLPSTCIPVDAQR